MGTVPVETPRDMGVTWRESFRPSIVPSIVFGRECGMCAIVWCGVTLIAFVSKTEDEVDTAERASVDVPEYR